MKKFIHRFRMFLFNRKEMSGHYLFALTIMDIGRWFFKKAHNCNRCGSPNVTGYCKGLYCPNCRDIMVKELK